MIRQPNKSRVVSQVICQDVFADPPQLNIEKVRASSPEIAPSLLRSLRFEVSPHSCCVIETPRVRVRSLSAFSSLLSCYNWTAPAFRIQPTSSTTCDFPRLVRPRATPSRSLVPCSFQLTLPEVHGLGREVICTRETVTSRNLIYI